MPLPMMGSHPGTLVSLAASSIHGQVNLTIGFHLDGTPDTQVHGGTIAREAVYADAKAGDAVSLTFMMGNLIAVTKRG
jgi:hypothetical protein